MNKLIFILLSLFSLNLKAYVYAPNVFVISACSLRPEMAQEVDGKIWKDLESGIVFTNAFTDQPWSTVIGLLHKISPKDLESRGYVAIGEKWRKRNVKVFHDVPPFFINAPIANHEKVLGELKNALKLKRAKPFFLATHFKYMHFPLSTDLQNKASDVEREVARYIFKKPIKASDALSGDLKKLYQEYLKNWKNYPEKLSLLYFLFKNDSMVRELLPKVRSILKLNTEKVLAIGPIGVTYNPKLLILWGKSKNFSKDLELIKILYKRKFIQFDESLKDILDIPQARPTMTFFIGDHGVPFMSHGALHSAKKVFDDETRIFLGVKIPGLNKRIIVNDQVYIGNIENALKKIMSLPYKAENIKDILIQELKQDEIYARSCDNIYHSIRYKNEHKLIVNFRSNERFLFDLKKDPREKTNLFKNSPGLSAQLEALILDNLSKVKNTQTLSCDFEGSQWIQ